MCTIVDSVFVGKKKKKRNINLKEYSFCHPEALDACFKLQEGLIVLLEAEH